MRTVLAILSQPPPTETTPSGAPVAYYVVTSTVAALALILSLFNLIYTQRKSDERERHKWRQDTLTKVAVKFSKDIFSLNKTMSKLAFADVGEDSTSTIVLMYDQMTEIRSDIFTMDICRAFHSRTFAAEVTEHYQTALAGMRTTIVKTEDARQVRISTYKKLQAKNRDATELLNAIERDLAAKTQYTSK